MRKAEAKGDAHRRVPRDWTPDERKLAFYLYCQLPFGKLHGRNTEVKELARVLDRPPGSVAMKLTNFASLDPAITSTGRRGLNGAAAGDREVWRQFHSDWQGLAEECEKLLRQRDAALAERDSAVVEDFPGRPEEDYSSDNRPVLSQQRVAQGFFRRAVLSSYDGKCCMSGLSSPSLLVASHIVPWSADSQNRLNPRNGLCLSALHDRAFDQYLITLDEKLRVVVSRALKSRCQDSVTQAAFLAIESKPITAPRRFLPDHEFVASHRREFLERHA